jgi:predicted acylesterase/phospholipase RssA
MRAPMLGDEAALGLGVILHIRLQPGAANAVRDPSPLRFRAPDGTYYVPKAECAELEARGVRFSVARELRADDLPVRFIDADSGETDDTPSEGAKLAVLARLLAEERATGDVSVRFLGRHRSVPPDGFVLDRADGARRYVWQIVPADAAHDVPRFEGLKALFGCERTKVVLSLGSGGLKLFSHASVLRLLERIGVADRLEEVWGTSAGALVALLYCHGLSPQAIEQTGYDLYAGRYQLELRPSKLKVLRELLREALLPSAEAAGFVDCARGLSRMLDEYCSALQPTRPLYVMAFNLDECRGEVLTPGPVPAHLDGFAFATDAREATLASCAVPLLFMPRPITRDGRQVPYIDGSTTEDVPLRSVVRKWDLDRAAGAESRERLAILYVKLSARSEQHRTTGKRFGKVRMLQAVASAGMETIHARDVELLAARRDVVLLPLELADDAAADFFEVSRIPEYIRRAKESFPRQLAELDARLRGA